MSDSTDFDRQEQLARIDRNQVETRKLIEGSDKFKAEFRKLMAEGAKLERERAIAPWQLAILMLGAFGGMIAGLSALLHLGAH